MKLLDELHVKTEARAARPKRRRVCSIGDVMTNLAQSCAVVDSMLIQEGAGRLHDVVAKVRHLLGGVKVGHAGTLDPAPERMLPC